MEVSRVNSMPLSEENLNKDSKQNEIPQLTNFQEESLQYNFKMINLILYNLNNDLNKMIESLSKRKKFQNNTINFDKMIKDIEPKNYLNNIIDNTENILETKKKLYSIVENVLNYLNIGEEYEPILRSNFDNSNEDLKSEPLLYSSEQLKMIELLIHDKVIVEDWYKNDLNL